MACGWRISAAAIWIAVVAALPASPARAQDIYPVTMTGNFGVLHTPDVTEPVFEVLTAAAGLLPYVVPYINLSWTFLADEDPLLPTVVTQAAVPVFERGEASGSVDVGATWYPHHDYRPRFTFGPVLLADLPLPRLGLFSLISLQPFHDWGWSFIGGIGYTFLERDPDGSSRIRWPRRSR